jgi:catechol-2,3-dioxygenase
MPTKLKPLAEAPRPINAGARIGHVHLKVADLDRALGFYTGVLGFELMQRYGQQAAFVSAGGYHHHIGLNTWESRGGQPPAPGTTGLYHVAIVYPTRADLAEALQRLARRRQRSRGERGPLSARPPTATASNSIGTVPKRCGRAIPTAPSP